MAKVKLFTHTDLDGIGCAIVAFYAFGRENVDVEYCDYNNVNERVTAFLDSGKVAEYSDVFITDISVNEAVAERLDTEIYQARKSELWLYDHHATSTWLNRYDWPLVMVEAKAKYLRSGTEMLFVDVMRINQGMSALSAFVEKVRRYDTWEWKTRYDDDDAKELNDLFYIIGRDRFIERFMVNPSVDFTESERLLLDIESGRREAYMKRKVREVSVREIAGKKVGVVFAEQYLSELGNRIVEELTDIDCVALINPSLSVSWRGIDRMDCGQFAQQFGGGGHKNAAGSPVTDDMRAQIISVIFGEVTIMANKQPADNKRNLADDLRICESATPGPWQYLSTWNDVISTSEGEFENAIVCKACKTQTTEYAPNPEFIAEARTGWPHAIQRAINAEGRISGLEAEIAYLSASKAEQIRQNTKLRAYAYFLRECLRNGVQIPYDYNFSAFKEAYCDGQTEDYEI